VHQLVIKVVNIYEDV